MLLASLLSVCAARVLRVHSPPFSHLYSVWSMSLLVVLCGWLLPAAAARLNCLLLLPCPGLHTL